MRLNLGETIRELRRRDGRKQEDLAKAMGVSPQAVSRWELGVGYPDMEIIPSIANYFHVTIDTLFGYNDDREARVSALIDRADAALGTGQGLAECEAALREAVGEFPAEAVLWLKWGLILSALAIKVRPVRIRKKDPVGFAEYDTDYNGQNTMAHEAVEVLERALEMGLDADGQSKAVLTLVIQYATMGMYDRAKALAVKQSPLDAAREFILTYASCGRERDSYNGNLVIILLRMLKLAAAWGLGTNYATRGSDYALRVLEAIAELYRTIVPDGDFGVEHSDLSDLYACGMSIAARAGDYDAVASYLDQAVAHRTAYEEVRKRGEVAYTAPLLASVIYDGAKLPPYTMVPLSTFCSSLPQEIKERLREDGRYRTLFE